MRPAGGSNMVKKNVTEKFLNNAVYNFDRHPS